MLWDIWKGRNDLVFEHKPINIQSTIAHEIYWFSMFYYYEEGSDVQATVPIQTFTATVKNQRWRPPLANMTKLNVDAAWRTDRSSYAVVGTNQAGKFLCAQADVADYQSPLLAEASGFLLAIRLVADMKFNRIVIEGDSQRVVLALNGVTLNVPWRLLWYIDQIKLMVSKFDQVVFLFVLP
ncbi:uncharacterized protein LOC113295134 [Papaver somniferum]|uniref:uncharacterized protein LOC113295134 n=1 Tax=Papaver somniferum TaxID=3469 RepID=UPI000E6F58F5|nr:uncharacterized protein LOC113295134 [Papaver somniferum]